MAEPVDQRSFLYSARSPVTCIDRTGVLSGECIEHIHRSWSRISGFPARGFSFRSPEDRSCPPDEGFSVRDS